MFMNSFVWFPLSCDLIAERWLRPRAYDFRDWEARQSLRKANRRKEKRIYLFGIGPVSAGKLACARRRSLSSYPARMRRLSRSISDG